MIRFLKLNIGIEYVISDILSLSANEQFEANTRTDEIERQLKKIRAVSYYLFHQINEELEGKHVLFIMDAPRHNIYDNNLSDSRVLKLNKMVDSLSNELTFNFLDLTQPMEIDYQKNKTRFETKYDGHWNDYGHEFVAKTLYEYFVKKTNN